MDEKLVNLTIDLYANMKRRLKKGHALSEPFSTFSGMGQGDVLSLIPAMLLAPWQFWMLDTLHPGVRKNAYYDDRRFRGCLNDLIEVDNLVHEFGAAAGHSTQAENSLHMHHVRSTCPPKLIHFHLVTACFEIGLGSHHVLQLACTISAIHIH